MTNATQEKRIINRLLEYGVISRNQCLNVKISRLGAIIEDLEKDGWVFKPSYTEDRKDYYYEVVYCPLQAIEYRVGDRIILKYERKTENA